MSLSLVIFIIAGVIIITAVIIIIYRVLKKDDFYIKVEAFLKTGNYGSALSLCLKRIDSQPQDFVIKYYVGEAYEGLKDYTKAILYYEKASISASTSDNQEMKIPLFMKTAELLKKMQKPQAALGYYALVLDREPMNTKALYAAGEVLFESKNYQRAKSYLETLIKAKPEQLKGRFILAKIYSHLRQFPEAAQQLEYIVNDKLVEHDVMKDNSSLLLSEVYVGMKSYQKAIALLKPLLNDDKYYEDVIIKIIEIMLESNQLNDTIQLIRENLDKVGKEKKRN